MSENIGRVAPLNWRALVDEALRRRKAEKLTQRQHAALASVSVPTIVAFDRGERTLSLAKAFDILRVVGLMDEPAEDGAQEAFVQEAFARWRELTSKLPEDSPARFPHGWYRIDYALEGDLRQPELHELHEVLTKAELRLTGWPTFWVPTRQDLIPREVDGVIECWLSPLTERAHFDAAAHCDFWRAAPTGRMFLIRGYQEDSQETFPPATIFDSGLPIWRLGEALLHAARLSELLKKEEGSAITVRFRALYSGLLGRILKAWANPLTDLLVEGAAARSDEAMLETTVPASTIEQDLASVLFPLMTSLYGRFGVTGLAPSRVQAEVERRQNLVRIEVERLQKSRTPRHDR
jgi:transcriptional regulator with XRE-family HTH domain